MQVQRVLMKELTEERTDVELIQALVDAFGISPTQAEQEVRTFIGELDRTACSLALKAASAIDLPRQRRQSRTIPAEG